MAKPEKSAEEFYMAGDEGNVRIFWDSIHASERAQYRCGLVLRVCVLHGQDITEEPDAVIPHVRICVGAPRQRGVLP